MLIVAHVLLPFVVQCRHLIPTLNAWETRAKCTTARPIANQFPGHGCMNDLNVALIRKLRGYWGNWFVFLMCYPWVFIQPGTGRRPVDWSENNMSIHITVRRVLFMRYGREHITYRSNTHAIYVQVCFSA